MKRFFGWLARLIASVLTLLLVIVLLPYASDLAARLLPDTSASAIQACNVLASNLNNSARLETLAVQENGVCHEDIMALFLGSVASVDVSYEYKASFGVDLKDVQMSVSDGVITFTLPAPVVIQDSITALETHRDDFLLGNGYPEDSLQRLLETEKLQRRESYITGENSEALWNATIAAFENTIAPWLKDINGALSFQYLKAEPAMEQQP